MKLQQKNKKFEPLQYYCDLTTELDVICGYAQSSNVYKNYIHDVRDVWQNTLAIRVPGRTVGNIVLNNENCIEKITISPELIGINKQYPQDLYEKINHFIGSKIEFPLE